MKRVVRIIALVAVAVGFSACSSPTGPQSKRCSEAAQRSCVNVDYVNPNIDYVNPNI